jgi:hypothetical protein
MELARQAPVSTTNFGGVGVPANAEHLIIISLD